MLESETKSNGVVKSLKNAEAESSNQNDSMEVYTARNKTLLDFKNKVDSMHSIRHETSARLESHRMLSEWTLALLTIAIIILELESQAASHNELFFYFSEPWVNIAQVGFAVMILTYSLLLSINGYSAKSTKLYDCGLSLGKLCGRIILYIDSSNGKPNKEIVEKFSSDYNSILSKCENHKKIDYLTVIIREPWFSEEQDKQFSDECKKNGSNEENWWPWIKWIFKRKQIATSYKNIYRRNYRLMMTFITFFHYFVSIILVYGFLAAHTFLK